MDGALKSDGEKLLLFYLGADSNLLKRLSFDNDFIVKQMDDPLGAEGPSPSFFPDIVLMDLNGDMQASLAIAGEYLERFTAVEEMDPPLYFVLLDAYPPGDIKDELYEIGIDALFIQPLSIKELHHRLRFFVRFKDLSRKHAILEHRLNRSFKYLDRFESVLKTTKDELMDEKSSLNNALKQIQHMTSQRHRMEEQIKVMNQRNRSNGEGMGTLLSSLVEMGVERNRGHGNRVAQIAFFLGNALGIKGKKLDDLQKAAILHEVGLLAYSSHDSKIEKDRNSKEGNVPRNYPVKGADLLSKCHYFEGCAQILRYMNENSDGTGFPEGLKRKNIPLESRILAAADILDTLRQEGVNGVELISALDAMAGGRLDPMMVKQLEVYLAQNADAASAIRGIGIDQLEPGMELSAALFTESGTKLFSMGTVLTPQSIEKLVQYSREYPVNETVYIKA